MEMEKRRYPRKASFEPCNVEIFFLEEFTFGSRVLNYSTGGVMLESDYLLLEWSPVTIKFDAEKKGIQASTRRATMGSCGGVLPRKAAAPGFTEWVWNL